MHSTPLARLLPLDSTIKFHRIVGSVIMALALWHIGWHYADFVYFQRTLALPIVVQLQDLTVITGHLIAACMLLMVFGAVKAVRQAGILFRSCGGFDVFWWTHRLYIPALGMLIVHSPRYWMWAFLVLALFIADQVIRCQRGAVRAQLLRVVLEEV
jgi:NADPH oxidase